MAQTNGVGLERRKIIMVQDLFTKPKSMCDRVLNYCRQQKGFITSIDIENLKDHIRRTEGNVPGIMRIHREFRALAKTDENPKGVMRRLNRQEKLFRGFKNPDIAIYEWIGDKKPMRWTNLPVTPMSYYPR